MKYTKEEINTRLAPRGIALTGEFVGTRHKSLFQCSFDHQWTARTGSVLSGNGCPHCSGKASLTKEVVNDRIHDTGIRLIGEYVDRHTKAEFLCARGHQWKTQPGHVMSGKGCPYCSVIDITSTRELINERISHRGIWQISEYKNAKTKAVFECSIGHRWEATPDNIIRGKGCPTCADYGFNPSSPAWEYAFTRDGYLKYGITNDLTRRLNEHRRHGEFTLVHERCHEVGQLALDWENNIKRTHGGRFATKEQCPDGYTETLPVALLEEVKRASQCPSC